MKNENTPLKVVFAPGCFDDFDGTQEELDELIKSIHKMAESNELQENMEKVNFDDLPDHVVEKLQNLLDSEDFDDVIKDNTESRNKSLN